ncbi:IS200/IS605 family transposase [Nitrospira sp. M1]
MVRSSINTMWCGFRSIGDAILRGVIKLFVEEHISKIQHYHPDVEVKQWSVQVDHIHVVLVIPPKYAVSSIVGKVKANVSRQLRLRYPELKRTYWGAVLWSPGFFSSTVGLNEAVIRRYVAHQEQVDKGHFQLAFEF